MKLIFKKKLKKINSPFKYSMSTMDNLLYSPEVAEKKLEIEQMKAAEKGLKKALKTAAEYMKMIHAFNEKHKEEHDEIASPPTEYEWCNEKDPDCIFCKCCTDTYVKKKIRQHHTTLRYLALPVGYLDKDPKYIDSPKVYSEINTRYTHIPLHAP